MIAMLPSKSVLLNGEVQAEDVEVSQGSEVRPSRSSGGGGSGGDGDDDEGTLE